MPFEQKVSNEEKLAKLDAKLAKYERLGKKASEKASKYEYLYKKMDDKKARLVKKMQKA